MVSPKLASPKFRLLAPLLLALFAAPRAPAEPVTRLTSPVVAGRVCEWRIAAPLDVEDPFDPQAPPQAEFVSPTGKPYHVSAFYFAPHRPVARSPSKRTARSMRIFSAVDGVKQGRRLEVLLDDLRLVNLSIGETLALDDFEGRLAWREQGARLALDPAAAHSGRRGLRLAIDVDGQLRWPGISRDLGGASWEAFDEIRLWVKPLKGKAPDHLALEFYTIDDEKVQEAFSLKDALPGEWTELVWRFPERRDAIQFEPHGEPQWRVRLLPLEPGEWRASFTWREGEDRRKTETTFRVTGDRPNGLVRVSPRDPRFLEFASGRPYFAIGSNLIGSELGHYRYYLDRLAKHGGNCLRIWLSPRTLGFELEPGRYAQDRAAQFDALLELCRERGIHVMVCLTDYRELATSNYGHGYWERSPFNAALGGPCREPEDFYTDRPAAEFYRRKLHYAVARYASHPNLLTWEFFNEVNITNGWRTNPDTVRRWHARMAPFLKNLDPYGRLVTSSFAGLEDDPLWTQPGMELTQRHFYLQPGASFVDTCVAATAALSAHRKPVLIGEFGRRQNEWARLDAAGVSLHNGLWSSALSGGCGAALPWWWEWMDVNNLWPQYAALAEFLEQVDWAGEGFAPLSAEFAAQPASPLGFGRIAATPQNGGFKPAAWNRASTVTLGAEGVDKPERLARFLHGVRNHLDLHNPLTIHVDYVQAGEFGIEVAGVSQHGGATLELAIDGKVALWRQFASAETDVETVTRYNERYTIPVPAGRHEIRIANRGADWLTVKQYDFSGARMPPPLQLVGLGGRRTALVWLWNRTAAWDQPILKKPRLELIDVTATLREMPQGVWRARPFDPWTGEWGQAFDVRVGADGRLSLTVPRLSRDCAWRLDRVNR